MEMLDKGPRARVYRRSPCVVDDAVQVLHVGTRQQEGHTECLGIPPACTGALDHRPHALRCDGIHVYLGVEPPARFVLAPYTEMDGTVSFKVEVVTGLVVDRAGNGDPTQLAQLLLYAHDALIPFCCIDPPRSRVVSQAWGLPM